MPKELLVCLIAASLLIAQTIVPASAASCKTGKVPPPFSKVNSRGQPYTINFKSGGWLTAKSVSSRDGRQIADTGKWSCESGKICVRYDNWPGNGCLQ
jgi:hypothetical protein